MSPRQSISVAPGRRGTERRGVAAALAALLAAGGALDTAAEPLVIEARPVALNPADPTQTRVGALVYLGGLELTSPDARFGGLSGLAIDAGNGRLLAVTDHGHWVAARLVLDGDGAPIGIAEGEIAPIRDHGGRLLSGSWGDAEDIVRLADGRLAVSFERQHRVALYAADAPLSGGRAVRLEPPRRLAWAPNNGGIEALTEVSPGRLLAVTEGLYAGDGRLRGWLLSAPDGTDGAAADPADATALFYATEGAYQPTALATPPGGDVLALERRYTVADGPSARLLRITGAAIFPGATLAGVELARLAKPLTVDNFEGLAVGRDASGRVIVTIISDDNFNPLQRTLLLRFHLIG